MVCERTDEEAALGSGNYEVREERTNLFDVRLVEMRIEKTLKHSTIEN